MMHDDELDRLLAALPLEEPPATLHARILATIAGPPAPPVRVWEPWVVGLFAALTVWLSWGVVSHPHLADAIWPSLRSALASAQLWLWVALGALVAIVPSTVTLPALRRANAR